ncbi:MAG: FAD-dependent oxidoreductase [Alphaproteobacteria bacterium]|nr:FAD-dependent oxidoreductase [Alphaproteobacteria bacterium]
MKNNVYLTKPQFDAETEKCLQCKAKPCMKACSVLCSPCDFIAAAKNGDIRAAASLIAEQNALGEVCGLICPDTFCMKACVRQNLDSAIKIPAVQAYIMRQARTNNLLIAEQGTANGKKIAVIGLGPAGIGAVAELIKRGFSVEAFEEKSVVGGALNLIPQSRLPREIIAYEWQKLLQSPLVTAHFNHKVTDYAALLRNGFDAVIVAIGEQKCRKMSIEGEENALLYTDYLQTPEKYQTNGNVAVIGGGAVAVDCAVTARENGAANVEMFVRRKIGNMRITLSEREILLKNDIDITTMTRVAKIEKDGDFLIVYTVKTQFNEDGKLIDVPNTMIARKGFKHIVYALGSSRAEDIIEDDRIIYAGDFVSGGSTAVQAVASGKEAAKKVENLCIG